MLTNRCNTAARISHNTFSLTNDVNLNFKTSIMNKMANITGPAFIFNGLPENITKNDNTISPLAAPVLVHPAAIVNFGKGF